MKHTITFHTPDDKVSSIHDIKVSFYDQDGKAYSITIKSSKQDRKIISIKDIVNKRIAELNTDDGK